MNQTDSQAIHRLRKSVQSILANNLSYPKTLLSLCPDKVPNAEQVIRAKELIDESIRQVDGKFIDYLEGTDAGSGLH